MMILHSICYLFRRGERAGLLPLGNQLADAAVAPSLQHKFCLQLNVSECDVSASESRSNFVATVYNSRSQLVSTYVRLPINDVDGVVFTVADPDG